MCFNPTTNIEESGTLSMKEIERVASYFDGLFQLTLSGGEPILRQCLPDIVRIFNKKKPIPRITLTTNGQLPEELELVVRQVLIENPASTINVALSLDGVAEKHDDIRGTPGAFEKFLESMQIVSMLRKKFKNLTLVTASTISAFNQDHLTELLDFINKQPEPQIFGMMLVRGLTREKEAIAVDRERFLLNLERLHQIQKPHTSNLEWAWNETYHRNRVATIRQQRMIDPCWAGSKLLVLTHDGYLWPCEPFQCASQYSFPPLKGGFCFGNVRAVDFDIHSLMKSRQALCIRRYIADRKCSCTFECALLNNFALNPMNYIKMLRYFKK